MVYEWVRDLYEAEAVLAEMPAPWIGEGHIIYDLPDQLEIVRQRCLGIQKGALKKLEPALLLQLMRCVVGELRHIDDQSWSEYDEEDRGRYVKGLDVVDLPHDFCIDHNYEFFTREGMCRTGEFHLDGTRMGAGMRCFRSNVDRILWAGQGMGGFWLKFEAHSRSWHQTAPWVPCPICQPREAEWIFDEACNAFEDIQWGSDYGGDRWIEIAAAGSEYFNDRSVFKDRLIWIDHVLDLQHNYGSILNKGLRKQEEGEEEDYYILLIEGLQNKKARQPAEDWLTLLRDDLMRVRRFRAGMRRSA